MHNLLVLVSALLVAFSFFIRPGVNVWGQPDNGHIVQAVTFTGQLHPTIDDQVRLLRIRLLLQPR